MCFSVYVLTHLCVSFLFLFSSTHTILGLSPSLPVTARPNPLLSGGKAISVFSWSIDNVLTDYVYGPNCFCFNSQALFWVFRPFTPGVADKFSGKVRPWSFFHLICDKAVFWEQIFTSAHPHRGHVLERYRYPLRSLWGCHRSFYQGFLWAQDCIRIEKIVPVRFLQKSRENPYIDFGSAFARASFKPWLCVISDMSLFWWRPLRKESTMQTQKPDWLPESRWFGFFNVKK